jgi:hypothetical protein
VLERGSVCFREVLVHEETALDFLHIFAHNALFAGNAAQAEVEASSAGGKERQLAPTTTL